jgi:hypothetical protein
VVFTTGKLTNEKYVYIVKFFNGIQEFLGGFRNWLYENGSFIAGEFSKSSFLQDLGHIFGIRIGYTRKSLLIKRV